MISKRIRAACAAALLPPLSACVVVAMSNYAVPLGAQSAGLTFEMARREAMTVGQTIVFVNDDIAMTKPDMPAIYAIHNGDIAGERAGNILPDPRTQVEAGHKLFILAKTTYPTGSVSQSYCRSQVSFAPVAGHAYTMRHITDGSRCALLILDQATDSAPPDLQNHDASRVSLPI